MYPYPIGVNLRMSRYLIISVVCTPFLSWSDQFAQLQANEILWIGTAGTDFSNPQNWEGGVVPGTDDIAIISSAPADAYIHPDQRIEIRGLRIGVPDGGDGRFALLNGGQLNAESVYVAAPRMASGWLTFGWGAVMETEGITLGDTTSGGESTIRIDKDARVEVGSLGIRFTTASDLSAVSRILLEGNGLIDAVRAGQDVFPEVTGPATINFEGGSLRVAGEHTSFSSLSTDIQVYSWGIADASLLRFSHDITSDTTVITGTRPLLQIPARPGDADLDDDFDQNDLVRVLQAAKYLTGRAASWGEGDWNGGPGGTLEMPPMGDGVFDQIDIIASLNQNSYLTVRDFARQADSLVIPARHVAFTVPEPSGIALAIVGAVFAGTVWITCLSRQKSQCLSRRTRTYDTAVNRRSLEPFLLDDQQA